MDGFTAVLETLPGGKRSGRLTARFVSLSLIISVLFAPQISVRRAVSGYSRLKDNMVTIRLTRRGGKNAPFYHVMVTDSRKRQGGPALEQVGYFNPVAKGKERRLELNVARIDHWLGKGAQASERVAELLGKYRRQQAAA